MGGLELKTKTFFNETPYTLYQYYIPPLMWIPVTAIRSRQLTDYVLIFSLTCVTLAQIDKADATIFAMQGAVPSPGFATMYTLANQLNKITAYWTDDLRNLWGTSDDPLMIGMAPLPYKYLWLSGKSPLCKPGEDPMTHYCQSPEMNVQPKSLNGQALIPTLAQPLLNADGTPNLNAAHCPIANKDNVSQAWNTFVSLLKQGEDIQSQNNKGTATQRTKNMIKMGHAMIDYITITKKHDPNLRTTGWNWAWSTDKSVPPSGTNNTTLYWDLEKIISQNLDLLYEQERDFFNENTHSDHNRLVTLDRTALPNLHGSAGSHPNLIKSNTSTAAAMVKGMRAMMEVTDSLPLMSF